MRRNISFHEDNSFFIMKKNVFYHEEKTFFGSCQVNLFLLMVSFQYLTVFFVISTMPLSSHL